MNLPKFTECWQAKALTGESADRSRCGRKAQEKCQFKLIAGKQEQVGKSRSTLNRGEDKVSKVE